MMYKNNKLENLYSPGCQQSIVILLSSWRYIRLINDASLTLKNKKPFNAIVVYYF